MSTRRAATSTPSGLPKVPHGWHVPFIVGLASVALIAAAYLGAGPTVSALVLLALAVFAVRRIALTWRGLLLTLPTLALLVPFNRYTIPVGVGLQPLVALAIIGALVLIGAHLAQPSLRWQASPLSGPLVVLAAAFGASVVVNIWSLQESHLLANVVREATIFTAVVLAIFFVTRQLLRSAVDADALLVALAGLATVVALAAIMERASGVNVFLTLGNFLPLNTANLEATNTRDGAIRAVASMAHPLELGVLLAFLLPVFAYLIRYSPWPRSRRARAWVWSAALGTSGLAMLFAMSRTSIVMVATMALLAVVLLPGLLRYVVGSAIFGTVALMLVVPEFFRGTLMTLFDLDALLASQYGAAGLPGAGRLSDLDGSLERIAQHPLLGTGLGSRLVVGSGRNAVILDNQYLSSAEEAGLIGVVAIVALLGVAVWRLIRVARDTGQPDDRRHLAVAIAVSIAGYALALALFDGFGFRQSLAVVAMLLAVGSWVISLGAPDADRDRLT